MPYSAFGTSSIDRQDNVKRQNRKSFVPVFWANRMKIKLLYENDTTDVPVVCMYCKKVVGHKTIAGRWDADTSTSTICPSCMKKFHPDLGDVKKK